MRMESNLWSLKKLLTYSTLLPPICPFINLFKFRLLRQLNRSLLLATKLQAPRLSVSVCVGLARSTTILGLPRIRLTCSLSHISHPNSPVYCILPSIGSHKRQRERNFPLIELQKSSKNNFSCANSSMSFLGGLILFCDSAS